MLIFFAVLGGFILDAIRRPRGCRTRLYIWARYLLLDRSLRKILPKTPRGERIGGAITASILPARYPWLSGAVCHKIHWVFGL